MLGTGTPAAVAPARPTTTASPPAAPLARDSAARAEAFFQALAALGTDYRYGGQSPAGGFDCSGLVAHVYREAWGIQLPHSASAQSKLGVPIGPGELETGDLVFYNTRHRPFSHVGIYLGDGRFVHAPKTGAQVRVESLRTSYWVRRYDGARRLEPVLHAAR